MSERRIDWRWLVPGVLLALSIVALRSCLTDPEAVSHEARGAPVEAPPRPRTLALPPGEDQEAQRGSVPALEAEGELVQGSAPDDASLIIELVTSTGHGVSRGAIELLREPKVLEDGRSEEPGELGQVRAFLQSMDEKGMAAWTPEAIREFERLQTRSQYTSAARTDVDDSGRASFQGLPAGRVLAVVAPESLPAGLIPPYRQERVQRGGGDGFHGAWIELEAGKESRARLVVHEPATIEGRVLGPARQGLAGVSLHANNERAGLENLRHETISGEDGSFRFEGVYPGVYTMRSFPPEDLAESMAARVGDTSPPPEPPLEILELLPGQGRVIEIWLRPGPVEVVGRVIDQYGKAMAELEILASYSGRPEQHGRGVRFDWTMQALRTRTDAEGRFTLSGLHAEPTELTVAPEGAMNGIEAWRQPLLEHGPTFALDLIAKSGTIDLGEIVVQRNDAFVVRGCLMTEGVDHGDRRPPEPKGWIRSPEVDERGRRFQSRAVFDAQGCFEARCAGRLGSAELVLRFGRRELRRELTPVPDGELDLGPLNFGE